jgi:hypothetical protein
VVIYIAGEVILPFANSVFSRIPLFTPVAGKNLFFMAPALSVLAAQKII